MIWADGESHSQGIAEIVVNILGFFILISEQVFVDGSRLIFYSLKEVKFSRVIEENLAISLELHRNLLAGF